MRTNVTIIKRLALLLLLLEHYTTTTTEVAHRMLPWLPVAWRYYSEYTNDCYYAYVLQTTASTTTSTLRNKA